MPVRWEIIKKGNNLRKEENPEYNKIGIIPDQPRNEREESARLVEELQERR